jgi:hypothetical protein
MRSARFAQWILALVTTYDRAAATVGDLMEDVQTRGALWFWASVVGTAFSIAWHGARAGYRRIGWFAVRGILFTWLLAFAAILPVVMLQLILLASGSHKSVDLSRGWALYGTIMVELSLVPFLTERWVARHAPGRAITAFCALAILMLLLGFGTPQARLMTAMGAGGFWRSAKACLLYGAGSLFGSATTAWRRRRIGLRRPHA